MKGSTKLGFRRRSPSPVAGWHLPPPRPTRRAWLMAFCYLALPLLVVLLLADLVLYLLFAVVLGRCYGVLCLLG